MPDCLGLTSMSGSQMRLCAILRTYDCAAEGETGTFASRAAQRTDGIDAGNPARSRRAKVPVVEQARERSPRDIV